MTAHIRCPHCLDTGHRPRDGMTGRAVVLQGDARHLPLPDESVDLIATSVPYWGQRDYQDGGKSMPHQIGNEPTWQEWLAKMMTCVREWKRVLKPSGSMFINCGDKYTDKEMLGLPWRLLFACTDQLGLIHRRDIVWHKVNGLPESCNDRCRTSHEYLFHLVKQPRYYAAIDEIREDYAPVQGGRNLNGRKVTQAVDAGWFRSGPPNSGLGGTRPAENPLGKLPGSVWSIPSAPLQVPTHLGIEHYAAFPPALVRPLVLGWSPPGICTTCGEGRRPVPGYDREPAWREVQDKRISEEVTIRWCSAFTDWCEARNITRRDLDAAAGTSDMGAWWASRLPHRCAVPTPEQYALLAARWPEMPAHPGDDLWEPYTRRVAWSFHDHANDAVRGLHYAAPVPRKVNRTITGYVCACPTPNAPTRPAVVLDPFGGTGTTALVAAVHGRVGVSIDRSADYTRLAQWRVHDPGERARALGVPKPPPIPDGQHALFDLT